MSENRVPEGPILPHSDFGDADCCGTLWGLRRDDQPGIADIICNECGVTVKTVPSAELQRTLDTMELSLDSCTVECPHCGTVNLFAGFSSMLAFTCRECGEGVNLRRGEP